MKYVLSDIHGNLDNWNAILNQIELGDDDELYVLGDVIDRYPHGIQILRQIMSMKNTRMLLGNHEYMMLDALGCPYDGKKADRLDAAGLWYRNDGFATEEAFYRLAKDKQREIINYLQSLPLNISVEAGGKKYRLCHATLEELYDHVGLLFAGMSKAYFTVWDREYTGCLKDVQNVKVVFGHTPTIEFQPEKNPLEIYEAGNAIGIDCGSGFLPKTEDFLLCEGRLACIRLDDGKVFYSNGQQQMAGC